MVTLYPEGSGFAPLYLWSRADSGRGPKRWRSFATQDLAVGARGWALARLGEGGGVAHAYLAAPWSRPLIEGDWAFSQVGETYAALSTPGGWDLASATERLPDLYRDHKSHGSSWVLVPRRQPAAVGLAVGRRSEGGTFEVWREGLEGLRLGEEQGVLSFGPLRFAPGQWATFEGTKIQPSGGSALQGPFLRRLEGGEWRFSFSGRSYRLDPLAVAR
jgi:hypothetical protein